MAVCPSCRHDNLPGADLCEDCGQDMANMDVPQAREGLQGRIMSDRLASVPHQATPMFAPSDPVSKAVKAMREARVGCVLVVENEKLAGILSERDLLMKIPDPNIRLEDIPIADLMAPSPEFLRDDDAIAYALHKMSIGGFRHIPILTDGRPTGCVSIRGILHHLCHPER